MPRTSITTATGRPFRRIRRRSRTRCRGRPRSRSWCRPLRRCRPVRCLSHL